MMPAPRTLPERVPRGPGERLSRAELEWRYEYQRRRYLPQQLDAARRKVEALENEARRYGMSELLTNPAHVDAAWDREVTLAQDEARANGRSEGFGDGRE